MDFAMRQRRELIDGQVVCLTPEQRTLIAQRRMDVRRAAVIARMGDKYVLHPNYDASKHPHHAPAHKESVVMRVIADRARREGRL